MTRSPVTRGRTVEGHHLPRGGHADDHARAPGRQRLRRLGHRRGVADGHEREVGAAPGDAADLADRILLRRVDGVGGAERPGLLELGPLHVDGDDRVRRHHRPALHRIQADASDPKMAMLAPGGTAAVLITAPTPVMTEQPMSAARSSGMALSIAMAEDSCTTVREA